MTNKNWHWYGMWFWDYLNLDRDDICTEAFEGFDIWRQAYTQELELTDASDLELIENHYIDAMEPVFNSWLFKAWYLFYLPSMMLRALTWRLRIYVVVCTSKS